VRVAVGRWDFQFFLANQVGKTYGLKNLPGFIAPMDRGDFRPLGRAAVGFRRGPVGSLMPWAMLCSGGVSPERLRDVERTSAGTLLGGAVNFPFPGVGEALGIRDLGAASRAPVRSRVPVLFISGTLDGESPPADAAEVQGGFPNRSSLVVEGASHGFDLFYFAPGLKDHMAEFLAGRDLGARRVSILPFRFNPAGEGRD
jgi:pimeloyl-ACP methyl ester carboxylesterase